MSSAPETRGPIGGLDIITVSKIPKKGDQGKDVLALQTRLNELGVTPPLAQDGDFGSKTQANVSAFQKSKGLPGSGVIGEKTMELLGLKVAAVTAPVPSDTGESSVVISSGVDSDEGTRPWYRRMYAMMSYWTGQAANVARDAKLVLSYKSRYADVAKVVFGEENLWWVIGCIHYKEASCNFAGILHNGEKIIGTGKKTQLVPKGRGPFSTWEEAAIDALKGESLGTLKDFEIGNLLYAVERYNGSGYISGAGKADVSAYLWARTNVSDNKGKYVADGKFDANASTLSSSGFCALIKWLEENGHITIKKEALTAPVEKPGAKVTRAIIADKIVELIGDDVNAKLRESGGKNRGQRIDEFNRRVGVALGSPYCASAAWCIYDDACKILGLKNPIPKTASSQDFRRTSFVPAKYIRKEGELGKKGDVGTLQVNGDTAHGHHTTLREDQVSQPLFKTGEYNTDGSGTRDGDGAYWMTRSTVDKSKENSGKLFVSFADIPQWILDANA